MSETVQRRGAIYLFKILTEENAPVIAVCVKLSEEEERKPMGTNNCFVLGEVGVGEEGDQASSGTHPGLPLNQPLPNQLPNQPPDL